VFSHGICPHCCEELYPDVMAARRNRDEEGSGECDCHPPSAE
jgi:hypothetical protein